MPGYDCGFLWNTPLYLQPTKLSDTQALPTSWLGGHVTHVSQGGGPSVVPTAGIHNKLRRLLTGGQR